MFGKLFGKTGKPGKKTAKADRSARLRLEARRAQSTSAPKKEKGRKPPEELNAEDIRAIQDALSAARTETLDSVAPRAQGTQPTPPQSSRPIPGPSSGPAHTMQTNSADNRDQLIRTAMTVYKHKQKALSDLDPKERAKLRSLAEEMLGVGVSRTHPSDKKPN